ncbi:hypothetical protein [Cohnella fermenti]|uniref:Uncharacterized protein n=1 Tax=Cohnella fermenti TaxID=2565925 RepID=A0A4S4C955_9BACL|nr:hypothetical protein [Cohnella fermenti]THF84571.1 hypothetical protein E6C55_00890 [Cohnella fermenti]
MSHAFVIEPLLFFEFDSEDEQLEKCREWGLLSDKATRTKNYVYKGNGLNETVSIVGFVDKMTAVIEFENKQRHCIHPSFLKEMQAASYGLKSAARAENDDDPAASADEAAVLADEAAVLMDEPSSTEGAEAPEAASSIEVSEAAASIADSQAAASSSAVSSPSAAEAAEAAEPAKPKAKKGKAKLELPEEKVKMVATVQEFTTVPNHFSDTDDEVVIYEAVRIEGPEELELGTAWSSHSNTLKKLELAIGDTISFEAKVAAKKLTKHPVPYKINNPSKLQKLES